MDRKLAVPGAFADRVDDERSSRLYLALKRLVEAENLDAIAIRCWPELPRDYGQWPYLAVTRLADEGLPVACEGDVDGALTMLCCKFLGCGAPYISDWLEHDQTSFVCWHGGMCPTCLTSDTGDGGGPRIRPHFNNKKPAVVDARVPINQYVGRVMRAPVKFQDFRTGGRDAQARYGRHGVPLLGVRRRVPRGVRIIPVDRDAIDATIRTQVSRHDLQRPVEARETSAVGQQRPSGAGPLGQVRRPLRVLRGLGRDLRHAAPRDHLPGPPQGVAREVRRGTGRQNCLV